MNAEGKDILVPGSVQVTMTQNGKPRTHLVSQVHHRACFAGSMFAMGGALFNIPDPSEDREQTRRRAVSGLPGPCP